MRMIAIASAVLFLGLTVTAQDSRPFKKEKEIDLGGSPGFDYLTVDAATHRLYVAHGAVIDVIDTEKNEKVGEVAGVEGSHGVALAPKVKRGFATAGKANKVVVFDLTTLKEVGAVETGKKPDAILFVAGANEVWSFNGTGKSVTCINAETMKVVATVDVGGKPEFAADDAANGVVYLNIEDKNAVVAINVKEHKVVATHSLAPCDSPTGLALDAAHGVVFAGCDGKLAILDVKSGKLMASPEIPKGCDAVAFDVATQMVYASCGSGKTAMFHGDGKGGYAAAGTFDTASGARTCALDPVTHKLYFAVGPKKGEKGGLKVLVFAPAAMAAK